LYADFNNADPAGRVRLNGAGSQNDLARLGLQLREGLPVTIHDEELAADGEAVYSPDEGVWVVRIDWTLVRPCAAEPVAAQDR
jgi:hypothetical protein